MQKLYWLFCVIKLPISPKLLYLKHFLIGHDYPMSLSWDTNSMNLCFWRDVVFASSIRLSTFCVRLEPYLVSF